MKNHKVLSLILVIALLAGGLYLTGQHLRAQDDDNFTYKGETEIPDFPSDLEWLNVSEPLTVSDLKGKIVILDFWTYGCINCIHIIPDLRRLEEEFSDYLVVIGVHSAKFENEGQTENIRQIVQRYAVHHPVINDSEFVIWSTYGVRAWPTLMLIDPLNRFIGRHEGEGIYEIFAPILEVMVDEYGAAGLLDATPIEAMLPEIENSQESPLKYPGKVLADTANNRLIISDTAHQRLIVTNLDGFDSVEIIGTGERGMEDGLYNEAMFNDPQGLAIEGDRLYLADTGNHSIRVIDLENKTVSTLTGTGEQSFYYPPVGGNAPNVLLSSPWDLALHNNILYIAMAGSHQLWRIDLSTGKVEPHAGNGRENIIDGPLGDAQLAQPSGIDTDGTVLYFADSEVSAIRVADIDPNGQVETIVGTGLFDFGDVDGVADEVRLQHALGVTVAPDGLLYVADTYNNKIKVIDPVARESRTFAGDGTPGLEDGVLEESRFYEPGGIDYADGKLYIADTNNHAIRIIDLETQTVSTVVFADTTLLLPRPIVEQPTFSLGDEVIEVAAQTIAPGKGALVIDVILPEGYKLNDQAPFTVINQSDNVVTFAENFLTYREVLPELPVQLPVTFSEGETMFSTDVTIYWCEAVNYTLCFIKRITLQVPVTVDSTATSTDLVLSYTLIPPDAAASDFD